MSYEKTTLKLLSEGVAGEQFNKELERIAAELEKRKGQKVSGSVTFTMNLKTDPHSDFVGATVKVSSKLPNFERNMTLAVDADGSLLSESTISDDAKQPAFDFDPKLTAVTNDGDTVIVKTGEVINE